MQEREGHAMKKSSARKSSTRKRLTLAGVAAFAIGGMIGCNAPSASEPQAASTSKENAAARGTSRPSASAKARGASNARGASGQSPSSASSRKDLNNLKGAKLSITIMGDSYSSAPIRTEGASEARTAREISMRGAFANEAPTSRFATSRAQTRESSRSR